jgi:tRNA(Ile)-lysidine synthase
MANSRKSPSLNKDIEIYQRFKRALEDILARVSAFAPAQSISVAVAYSGGLDSAVLLHLVCQYAATRPMHVHAFHVHHGLSPNADAWMAHCEKSAGCYQVQFDAAKVNVAGIEEHGVEQAARMARYQSLGQLCRNHGTRVLLTAHHEDDQAETVMLQLMRGAGLPGLSGMALCQDDHALLGPGIFLGRPLLEITRKELESLACGQAIQFVLDESNADPVYKRNALRHEVFPVLEKHFPAFSALMARSASHAQTAQALLENLACIDLAACKEDDEANALDLERLGRLSNDRINNLLRYWLRTSGIQFPSSSRMAEIREQIFQAADDKHPVFDFDRVQLSKIGSRLEITPNLGLPPAEDVVLQWHGEQEIKVPQWQGKLILKHSQHAGVDPEKLRSHALVLRSRRGSERLKIVHNRPSKSLKNLFQESSMPAWQRKWLPILFSGNDLLFVAGLGMDIRHAATQNGIEIEWRPDWK